MLPILCRLLFGETNYSAYLCTNKNHSSLTDMPGIYLHIPFCKTRCIYCDFYSTTREDLKRRYVRALCKELEMRRDYLTASRIDTIYFGGGTPSQLDEEDFALIFHTLQEVYGLENATEITLEANPDDLTEDYVRMLRRFPFNRLSMGIQTFDDRARRTNTGNTTWRQPFASIPNTSRPIT